jgi:hypothetical protein
MNTLREPRDFATVCVAHKKNYAVEDYARRHKEIVS